MLYKNHNSVIPQVCIIFSFIIFHLHNPLVTM